MTMEELIAQMQHAASAAEAERIRLSLEAQFLPNQVLQRGAATMVNRIVDGLSDGSAAGVLESWELLAQLAAGASPPTSAAPDIVEATQGALRDAVPAVIARVGSSEVQSVDFLALDVLDAALAFLRHRDREAAIAAIRRFAARGAREERRAHLILRE